MYNKFSTLGNDERHYLEYEGKKDKMSVPNRTNTHCTDSLLNSSMLCWRESENGNSREHYMFVVYSIHTFRGAYSTVSMLWFLKGRV